MSWRAFGETFVTLLVIMDPIGNAPVFVALTHERPKRVRRLAAVQAVFAAGALVIVFALFGRVVLDYLHVTLASLTIAGGLLLLLVALEMLGGPVRALDDTSNVALVPLATPLLAGPGAIATVMVLTQRNPGAAGRGGVLLGIVAAVLVVGIALLVADQLARLLRPSGVHFLTRVLGLLLAAIAVQLVIDGVRATVHAG